MATNDWKAELKRRIKDIRDRKEQEQEVESRTKKYRKPAAPKGQTVPFPKQAQPEPAVEPVAEAASVKEKVETPPVEEPAPAEEVAAAPEQVEEPAEVSEEFEPETLLEEVEEEIAASEEEAPEEDAIFQVDEAEEEKPAVKHDEEAIRAELARLSGGRKKSKEKKEEPTLFPVEDQQKPAAESRVRMETPAVKEVIEKPFEKKPEPQPVATKAEPKIVETNEEPVAEEPDSLDAAIDQYIPAGPVDEEAQAEPEAKPKKRPAATVVDKTVRNMCLKRIAAAVSDIFLIGAVMAAVAWISGMIVQSSPLRLLTDSLLPFGAFAIALHFLYYVIFTATTGQTLGKAVFRLRVVKSSPGTLGLGQAALRWLLGIFGTALVFIGYLMMFVTRDGTALQDIVLQQRIRRTKKVAE